MSLQIMMKRILIKVFEGEIFEAHKELNWKCIKSIIVLSHYICICCIDLNLKKNIFLMVGKITLDPS